VSSSFGAKQKLKLTTGNESDGNKYKRVFRGAYGVV
jgi:hypothetical protein